MQGNSIVCGYLDVKISAKSRRGLTPWKVKKILKINCCFDADLYAGMAETVV
jgi:hypothetical protein